MRSASAKAIAEASNHIGKKPWQKPRVQQISMSKEFDPSRGISRAQWEAALELRVKAERMREDPQAQSRG